MPPVHSKRTIVVGCSAYRNRGQDSFPQAAPESRPWLGMCLFPPEKAPEKDINTGTAVPLLEGQSW